MSEVGSLKKVIGRECFHSESGEHTKYFIVTWRVDKPAVDCELEPNNQSAVVSIVMLSPMGKKEWQRDT